MGGGTAYRRLRQVKGHLDTSICALLEPLCSDGDENV